MNNYNASPKNCAFSSLAHKEKHTIFPPQEFSIIKKKKHSMKFICEFVTSVNRSKIMNRLGNNSPAPRPQSESPALTQRCLLGKAHARVISMTMRCPEPAAGERVVCPIPLEVGQTVNGRRAQDPPRLSSAQSGRKRGFTWGERGDVNGVWRQVKQ